jgi:CheY-like chemotaxis protein
MVINDDDSLLQLFQAMLSGAGYQVSIQAYSMHTLEEVQRTRPGLVIADCLPWEAHLCWQFLGQLQTTPDTAAIPVVASTTSPRLTPSQEAWLAAHDIPIIHKPFLADSFLLAIAQRVRNCAAA